MTNEQYFTYKKLILDEIARRNVVNPTELVLNVMSIQNPLLFNKDNFNTVLEELLENGEVLSLYFNSSNNGTHILYFPKGTHFNFNAAKIRSNSFWKQRENDRHTNT